MHRADGSVSSLGGAPGPQGSGAFSCAARLPAQRSVCRDFRGPAHVRDHGRPRAHEAAGAGRYRSQHHHGIVLDDAGPTTASRRGYRRATMPAADRGCFVTGASGGSLVAASSRHEVWSRGGVGWSVSQAGSGWFACWARVEWARCGSRSTTPAARSARSSGSTCTCLGPRVTRSNASSRCSRDSGTRRSSRCMSWVSAPKGAATSRWSSCPGCRRTMPCAAVASRQFSMSRCASPRDSRPCTARDWCTETSNPRISWSSRMSRRARRPQASRSWTSDCPRSSNVIVRAIAVQSATPRPRWFGAVRSPSRPTFTASASPCAYWPQKRWAATRALNDPARRVMPQRRPCSSRNSMRPARCGSGSCTASPRIRPTARLPWHSSAPGSSAFGPVHGPRCGPASRPN